MIPSSEALAENIRKHCQSIAAEIARRVMKEVGNAGIPIPVSGEKTIEAKIGLIVHVHAQGVLLDWFLGDFIPGRSEEPR
jgi:hypothetical protein